MIADHRLSSDQAGRYGAPACVKAFVNILTNAHSSLITRLAKVALGPWLPIRVAKNVALCMTTTCCLPLSSPSILARSRSLPPTLSPGRLFDSVNVVFYSALGAAAAVQRDLTEPR